GVPTDLGGRPHEAALVVGGFEHEHFAMHQPVVLHLRQVGASSIGDEAGPGDGHVAGRFVLVGHQLAMASGAGSSGTPMASRSSGLDARPMPVMPMFLANWRR